MAWWEPVPVSRVDPYEPVAATTGLIFVRDQDVVGLAPIYVVEATADRGVISVVPVNNAAFAQGTIGIELITQTYFQDNIVNFIPYEYWRKDAQTIDEGGGDGAHVRGLVEYRNAALLHHQLAILKLHIQLLTE